MVSDDSSLSSPNIQTQPNPPDVLPLNRNPISIQHDGMKIKKKSDPQSLMNNNFVNR